MLHCVMFSITHRKAIYRSFATIKQNYVKFLKESEDDTTIHDEFETSSSNLPDEYPDSPLFQTHDIQDRLDSIQQDLDIIIENQQTIQKVQSDLVRIITQLKNGNDTNKRAYDLIWRNSNQELVADILERHLQEIQQGKQQRPKRLHRYKKKH